MIPSAAQGSAFDKVFEASNEALGRLVNEDGEQVAQVVSSATELLQAARLGVTAILRAGDPLPLERLAQWWWALRLFARLLQTDRRIPDEVMQTASSEGAAGGAFLKTQQAEPAAFATALDLAFEDIATRVAGTAIPFVDHIGAALAGEPTFSDDANEIAFLPPQDPDALGQLIRSDERFNYFNIRDGVGRTADTPDITVELVRNLDGTFSPTSSVPQFIFVRLGFARNPDSLQVMRDLLFASLDSNAREVKAALKGLADKIKAAQDTRTDAALTNLKRDAKARMRLIFAIRRARDSQAVPALVAALEDKNPQVRAAAADALKRLETADAIPALEKSLTDKDITAREQAALALARLSTNVAPLIKAFKGSKGRAKAAIIEAQGVMFAAASDADKATIKANIEAAAKDREPEVRIGALLAVAASEDPALAIEIAERLIKDKDPRVQAEAIDALRQIGLAVSDASVEAARVLGSELPNLSGTPFLLARAQRSINELKPREQVVVLGTVVNGVRPVSSLIIAIDGSGSAITDPDDKRKGLTKLQASIEEAKEIIEALPAGQKFNVIIYRTEATDKTGRPPNPIFKAKRLTASELNKLEAEGRVIPDTIRAGDLVPDSIVATDDKKDSKGRITQKGTKTESFGWMDEQKKFLESPQNRSEQFGVTIGRADLFGAIILSFTDPDIFKLVLMGDFKGTAGALTDRDAIADAVESFVKFTNVEIDTIVFGAFGTDATLASLLAQIGFGVFTRRSEQKQFPDVLPDPVFFAPVDLEQDLRDGILRLYNDSARQRAARVTAERTERSAELIEQTAGAQEGVRFRENLQLFAAQLRSAASSIQNVADREALRVGEAAGALTSLESQVIERLSRRGVSEQAGSDVKRGFRNLRSIIEFEADFAGRTRHAETLSLARFDFLTFHKMWTEREESRRRVEEAARQMGKLIGVAEESVQTGNLIAATDARAVLDVLRANSIAEQVRMESGEGQVSTRHESRLHEKIPTVRSLYEVLQKPGLPSPEEFGETLGRSLRTVRPRQGSPLRRAAPRAP